MEITVEVIVQAPRDRVWSAFVTPDAITRWNFASDDWCCPRASIDLAENGKFNYRMEEKNGPAGFDLEGEFTVIEANRRIEYRLTDGRKVRVIFSDTEQGTRVTETFEAESTHSPELQRQGWQAILDNFRTYTEGQAGQKQT